MTKIDENGEVPCSYCNSTGGATIIYGVKHRTLADRFLRRESKQDTGFVPCQYCHGKKTISWIDDIVPPTNKPIEGLSGVSGTTGYSGYPSGAMHVNPPQGGSGVPNKPNLIIDKNGNIKVKREDGFIKPLTEGSIKNFQKGMISTNFKPLGPPPPPQPPSRRTVKF